MLLKSKCSECNISLTKCCVTVTYPLYRKEDAMRLAVEDQITNFSKSKELKCSACTCPVLVELAWTQGVDHVDNVLQVDHKIPFSDLVKSFCTLVWKGPIPLGPLLLLRARGGFLSFFTLQDRHMIWRTALARWNAAHSLRKVFMVTCLVARS
jgi:hypothetical protein